MSGARSRGLNPRKSASPCSVTTISRSCSNQGRQPSVKSEHEAKKKHRRKVRTSLVYMARKRNDTTNARRIRFARARTGSMHDRKFRISQEIGRATDSVEHAGSQDVGRVGVGVLREEGLVLDGG